jgi:hypothetical protein
MGDLNSYIRCVYFKQSNKFVSTFGLMLIKFTVRIFRNNAGRIVIISASVHLYECGIYAVEKTICTISQLVESGRKFYLQLYSYYGPIYQKAKKIILELEISIAFHFNNEIVCVEMCLLSDTKTCKKK